MADNINYRNNLIKNHRAQNGLTDWNITGSVDNVSNMYFLLHSDAVMRQTLTLPEIYPTAFSLKALIGEATNDLGKPRLFLDIIISYNDKANNRIVRDKYSLPSVSPLLLNQSTMDGRRWNYVETTFSARDLPTMDSGYEILTIEAVVTNRGNNDGYITNLELCSTNSAPPTYGDGTEAPIGWERLPNGNFRFPHPSGSYIELGETIVFYAVDKIELKYR